MNELLKKWFENDCDEIITFGMLAYSLVIPAYLIITCVNPEFMKELNDLKLILISIGVNSTVFISQYMFLTVLHKITGVKYTARRRVIASALLGFAITLNLLLLFFTQPKFYLSWEMQDAIKMMARVMIGYNLIYAILDIPEIIANLQKNKHHERRDI